MAAGLTFISETPEAMAERAAQDFLTLMPPADAPGRFRIALSGGLTPKLFYQRIAQPPHRDQIPWNKLWIYWGDERCVPPEHPDSNYRMADETLLSKVSLRPSQVFRMRGEDPPPQAAQEYEKKLRDDFGTGEEWPIFDLVFMGLGADGHTASLFPDTPAVPKFPSAPSGGGRETPRWVVHNVVRALQTVRLTLTLPVFNHAKQVWFLVGGAKKKEAFARAREAPNPDCPASLVRPVQGELRWYADRTAVD